MSNHFFQCGHGVACGATHHGYNKQTPRSTHNSSFSAGGVEEACDGEPRAKVVEFGGARKGGDPSQHPEAGEKRAPDISAIEVIASCLGARYTRIHAPYESPLAMLFRAKAYENKEQDFRLSTLLFSSRVRLAKRVQARR